MKLLYWLIKWTLWLVAGLMMAIIIVFCIPGIYLPIPETHIQAEKLVPMLKGASLQSEIIISGYTSLDGAGNVDIKLRLIATGAVPLVQSFINQSVHLGKVGKAPGVRVWLDEVTLNSLVPRGNTLSSLTTIRGRVTNDITGADHKVRTVPVDLDIGYSESEQMLIITCQLGNVSNFPGEVEQVVNNSCRLDQSILKLTSGIAIHQFGHRFVGDGDRIGIEIVATAQPFAVIYKQLRQWVTKPSESAS